MTLEDLINTTTEELESLTDEQLLIKFADIFNLEPAIEETPEKAEDEDSSGPSPVPRKLSKACGKRAKAKAEAAETMKLLLELEREIQDYQAKKLTSQTNNGTSQANTSNTNPTTTTN